MKPNLLQCFFSRQDKRIFVSLVKLLNISLVDKSLISRCKTDIFQSDEKLEKACFRRYRVNNFLSCPIMIADI